MQIDFYQTELMLCQAFFFSMLGMQFDGKTQNTYQIEEI